MGVLVTFTSTTVAWGSPSLSLEPRTLGHELKTTALAERIEIPSELGSIKEVFIPQRDQAVRAVSSASPTIIHLEDAHGSVEAQLHQEEILRHLQKKYGLNTIFVEGGLGDLNPELLRFFEENGQNQKLIDKLTENGLVGGVERFLSKQGLVTRTLGLEKTRRLNEFLVPSPEERAAKAAAYGVEDAPLYRKGLELFREVYAGKSVSDKFLGDIRQKLIAQSAASFNPELKTFFREWLFQAEVREDILSHLSFLQKYAEAALRLDLTNAREQYAWPQLVRFFKLKKIEQEADSGQRIADSEKQKLEAWLKKNGLGTFWPVFEEVFSKSYNLTPNVLGDLRSQLEHFYEAAAPLGFKFDDYPVLLKRMGRAILSEEIQTEALLTEMEKMNAAILETLAKTPEERAGVVEYQEYLMLKKLFSLELTRGEYKKLLQRPEQSVERIGTADDLLSAKRSTLNALLRSARKFYSIAEQREQALFKNMLAKMKEIKQPNAVLITGGFHSDGLAEVMRAKGLSYVRMAPRISGPVDDSGYLKLMTLGLSGSPSRSSARFVSAETEPAIVTRDLGAPTAGLIRSEIRRAVQDIGAEPDLANAWLHPGAGETASRSNVKRGAPVTKDEVGHDSRSESRTLRPEQAVHAAMIASLAAAFIAANIVFAQDYALFMKEAGFFTRGLVKSVIGGIAVSIGKYISQYAEVYLFKKSDRIRLDRVLKWGLAGLFIMGPVTYWLWLEFLAWLPVNEFVEFVTARPVNPWIAPFVKSGLGLTFYTFVIGNPMKFWTQKMIESPKDASLSATLRKHQGHLYLWNFALWFPVTFVGWRFQPEQIVPWTAVASLAWAAVYTGLLNRWSHDAGSREIRSRKQKMDTLPRTDFILEMLKRFKAQKARGGQTVLSDHSNISGELFRSDPVVLGTLIRDYHVGFGKKVLDVGTGDGYAALKLGWTGAEVLSIEIDPARLKEAESFREFLGRSRYHFDLPNVTFKEEDFLRQSLRGLDLIYFYYTAPRGQGRSFARKILEKLDRELEPGTVFVSVFFAGNASASREIIREYQAKGIPRLRFREAEIASHRAVIIEASPARSEARKIGKEEIVQALETINQAENGAIFNEGLRAKIASKLASLELVPGKTALVLGPGPGDYLPDVLEKLGLKVNIFEPDEDTVMLDTFMKGKPRMVTTYDALGPARFDYIFCLGVITEALMGNNAAYLFLDKDPVHVSNVTKRMLWNVLEPAVARLNPEGGFLFVNSFGFGDPKASDLFSRNTFQWMEEVLQDPRGGALAIQGRPDMDVKDLCLVESNFREPRFGVAYHLLPAQGVGAPALVETRSDDLWIRTVEWPQDPWKNREAALSVGELSPEQVYSEIHKKIEHFEKLSEVVGSLEDQLLIWVEGSTRPRSWVNWFEHGLRTPLQSFQGAWELSVLSGALTPDLVKMIRDALSQIEILLGEYHGLSEAIQDDFKKLPKYLNADYSGKGTSPEDRMTKTEQMFFFPHEVFIKSPNKERNRAIFCEAVRRMEASFSELRQFSEREIARLETPASLARSESRAGDKRRGTLSRSEYASLKDQLERLDIPQKLAPYFQRLMSALAGRDRSTFLRALANFGMMASRFGTASLSDATAEAFGSIYERVSAQTQTGRRPVGDVKPRSESRELPKGIREVSKREIDRARAAVVFTDVHGVILKPVWELQFAEAYRRIKKQDTIEEGRQWVRDHLEKDLTSELAAISGGTLESVRELLAQIADDTETVRYPQPVPEFVEFLRQCKEMGIPIVITSGSRLGAVRVVEQLQKAGLQWLLDYGVFLGREEMKDYVLDDDYQKDTRDRAIREIRQDYFPGMSSLYFTDSEDGIAGTQAVGGYAFGVASAGNVRSQSEALAQAGADVVIEEMVAFGDLPGFLGMPRSMQGEFDHGFFYLRDKIPQLKENAARIREEIEKQEAAAKKYKKPSLVGTLADVRTIRHSTLAADEFDPYFGWSLSQGESEYLRYARVHSYLVGDGPETMKQFFSSRIRRGAKVLDLLAGSQTHLDPGYAKVTGVGLNAYELYSNPNASDFLTQDPNADPELPSAWDGTFDAVIMSSGMAYLKDPAAVFKAAARVLKPGGVLLIIYNDQYNQEVIPAWKDLKGSAARLTYTREALERSGGFLAIAYENSPGQMTGVVARKKDEPSRVQDAAIAVGTPQDTKLKIQPTSLSFIPSSYTSVPQGELPFEVIHKRESSERGAFFFRNDQVLAGAVFYFLDHLNKVMRLEQFSSAKRISGLGFEDMALHLLRKAVEVSLKDPVTRGAVSVRLMGENGDGSMPEFEKITPEILNRRKVSDSIMEWRVVSEKAETFLRAAESVLRNTAIRSESRQEKAQSPAGNVITPEEFRGTPYAKWAPWLRVFDIAISLLILLPAMTVASIVFGPLIKLESPGPIFFKQTRPGYKGRKFDVYKFRTMRVTGSRVPTRLGAFLRQTAIDELPQAINILRGEMSFFGPRPLPEGEMKWYAEEEPELDYATLLNVRKPGYCSLFMIKRGFGKGMLLKEEFREAIDLNAYEVRNWSLRLMAEMVGGTSLDILKAFLVGVSKAMAHIRKRLMPEDPKEEWAQLNRIVMAYESFGILDIVRGFRGDAWIVKFETRPNITVPGSWPLEKVEKIIAEEVRSPLGPEPSSGWETVRDEMAGLQKENPEIVEAIGMEKDGSWLISFADKSQYRFFTPLRLVRPLMRYLVDRKKERILREERTMAEDSARMLELDRTIGRVHLRKFVFYPEKDIFRRGMFAVVVWDGKHQSSAQKIPGIPFDISEKELNRKIEEVLATMPSFMGVDEAALRSGTYLLPASSHDPKNFYQSRSEARFGTPTADIFDDHMAAYWQIHNAVQGGLTPKDLALVLFDYHSDNAAGFGAGKGVEWLGCGNWITQLLADKDVKDVFWVYPKDGRQILGSASDFKGMNSDWRRLLLQNLPRLKKGVALSLDMDFFARVSRGGEVEYLPEAGEIHRRVLEIFAFFKENGIPVYLVNGAYSAPVYAPLSYKKEFQVAVSEAVQTLPAPRSETRFVPVPEMDEKILDAIAATVGYRFDKITPETIGAQLFPSLTEAQKISLLRARFVANPFLQAMADIGSHGFCAAAEKSVNRKIDCIRVTLKRKFEAILAPLTGKAITQEMLMEALKNNEVEIFPIIRQLRDASEKKVLLTWYAAGSYEAYQKSKTDDALQCNLIAEAFSVAARRVGLEAKMAWILSHPGEDAPIIRADEHQRDWGTLHAYSVVLDASGKDIAVDWASGQFFKENVRKVVVEDGVRWERKIIEYLKKQPRKTALSFEEIDALSENFKPAHVGLIRSLLFEALLSREKSAGEALSRKDSARSEMRQDILSPARIRARTMDARAEMREDEKKASWAKTFLEGMKKRWTLQRRRPAWVKPLHDFAVDRIFQRYQEEKERITFSWFRNMVKEFVVETFTEKVFSIFSLKKIFTALWQNFAQYGRDVVIFVTVYNLLEDWLAAPLLAYFGLKTLAAIVFFGHYEGIVFPAYFLLRRKFQKTFKRQLRPAEKEKLKAFLQKKLSEASMGEGRWQAIKQILRIYPNLPKLLNETLMLADSAPDPSSLTHIGIRELYFKSMGLVLRDEGLSSADNRRGFELILQGLGDTKDLWVRKVCAGAIGKFAHRLGFQDGIRAYNALTKLLMKEKEPIVRDAVYRSMGAFPFEPALEVLTEGLKAHVDDPWTQKYASESIGSVLERLKPDQQVPISSEVHDAIFALLAQVDMYQQPSVEVRVAAVDALARLREDTHPALVNLWPLIDAHFLAALEQDPDPTVRERALWAIARHSSIEQDPNGSRAKAFEKILEMSLEENFINVAELSERYLRYLYQVRVLPFPKELESKVQKALKRSRLAKPVIFIAVDKLYEAGKGRAFLLNSPRVRAFVKSLRDDGNLVLYARNFLLDRNHAPIGENGVIEVFDNYDKARFADVTARLQKGRPAHVPWIDFARGAVAAVRTLIPDPQGCLVCVGSAKSLQALGSAIDLQSRQIWEAEPDHLDAIREHLRKLADKTALMASELTLVPIVDEKGQVIGEKPLVNAHLDEDWHLRSVVFEVMPGKKIVRQLKTDKMTSEQEKHDVSARAHLAKKETPASCAVRALSEKLKVSASEGELIRVGPENGFIRDQAHDRELVTLWVHFLEAGVEPKPNAPDVGELDTKFSFQQLMRDVREYPGRYSRIMQEIANAPDTVRAIAAAIDAGPKAVRSVSDPNDPIRLRQKRDASVRSESRGPELTESFGEKIASREFKKDYLDDLLWGKPASGSPGHEKIFPAWKKMILEVLSSDLEKPVKALAEKMAVSLGYEEERERHFIATYLLIRLNKIVVPVVENMMDSYLEWTRTQSFGKKVVPLAVDIYFKSDEEKGVISLVANGMPYDASAPSKTAEKMAAPDQFGGRGKGLKAIEEVKEDLAVETTIRDRKPLIGGETEGSVFEIRFETRKLRDLFDGIFDGGASEPSEALYTPGEYESKRSDGGGSVPDPKSTMRFRQQRDDSVRSESRNEGGLESRQAKMVTEIFSRLETIASTETLNPSSKERPRLEKEAYQALRQIVRVHRPFIERFARTLREDPRTYSRFLFKIRFWKVSREQHVAEILDRVLKDVSAETSYESVAWTGEPETDYAQNIELYSGILWQDLDPALQALLKGPGALEDLLKIIRHLNYDAENFLKLTWPAFSKQLAVYPELKGLEPELFHEVALAGASGEALVQYGFSKILPGLNTVTEFPSAARRLLQLAQELGADAPAVLQGGVARFAPSIHSLSELEQWIRAFEQIARGGDLGAAGLVFNYGFAAFQDLIQSPADILFFGPGLVLIGDSAGDQRFFFFSVSLPRLRSGFLPGSFREKWPDLANMFRWAGENAAALADQGLSVFSPEEKDRYWDEIREGVMQLKGRSSAVLQYGIPAARHLLPRESFADVFGALVHLGLLASEADVHGFFFAGLFSLRDLWMSSKELRFVGSDLLQLRGLIGDPMERSALAQEIIPLFLRKIEGAPFGSVRSFNPSRAGQATQNWISIRDILRSFYVVKPEVIRAFLETPFAAFARNGMWAFNFSQDLLRWTRHIDKLDELFAIVDPSPVDGKRVFFENDPLHAIRNALSLQDRLALVGDILHSGGPTYIQWLNEWALFYKENDPKHQPAFFFLTSHKVDLRTRMQMLPAFMEVLFLRRFLEGKVAQEKKGWLEARRSKKKYEALSLAVEEASRRLNVLAAKVLDAKNLASRRKTLREIQEILNPLRKEFLQCLLSKPVTAGQENLLNDPEVREGVSTIAQVLSKLGSRGEDGEFGFLPRNSSVQELEDRIREALEAFFNSYEPSAKHPEEFSRKALAKYLSNIPGEPGATEIEEEKTPEAVAADVIHHLQEEGLWERGQSGFRPLPGNREIYRSLLDAGFSPELWEKGVDILVPVEKGVTEESKQERIFQITYEMIEIALGLGITELEGIPLSKDEKKNPLDNEIKAAKFLKDLQATKKEIPEALELRLEDLLEGVRREAGRPVGASAPTTVRATILKDFFKEVLLGKDVPGCYHPTGVNPQAPLVNAMEWGTMALQIYGGNRRQVANAVLLLTPQGVYVDPLYSSSSYDLDPVVGKALLELARYVPRIVLTPNSAGYAYLRGKAVRSSKPIFMKKRASVVRFQVFDAGMVDENGDLDLRLDQAIVLTPEIAARYLEPEKQAKAEAEEVTAAENEEKMAPSPASVDWQALANLFLAEEALTPYLKIIGAVKKKIALEGQNGIDETIYPWMLEEVRKRVDPDATQEKVDAVTDLVLEFLEGQDWPMEDISSEEPAARSVSDPHGPIPLRRDLVDHVRSESRETVREALARGDFETAGVQFWAVIDAWVGLEKKETVGADQFVFVDMVRVLIDRIEGAGDEELEFLKKIFMKLKSREDIPRKEALLGLAFALMERRGDVPGGLHDALFLMSLNKKLFEQWLSGRKRREIEDSIERMIASSRKQEVFSSEEVARIFDYVKGRILLEDETVRKPVSIPEFGLHAVPTEVEAVMANHVREDLQGAEILRGRNGRLLVYQYDPEIAGSQPYFAVIIHPSGVPLRMIIKSKAVRDKGARKAHTTEMNGNALLAAIRAPSIWMEEGDDYIYVWDQKGMDIVWGGVLSRLGRWDKETRKRFFFSLGVAMAEAHMLGVEDRPQNLILYEDRLAQGDLLEVQNRAVMNIDRENALFEKYLEQEPDEDYAEAGSLLAKYCNWVNTVNLEIFEAHLEDYVQGFGSAYRYTQDWYFGHRDEVLQTLERVAGPALLPLVQRRLEISPERLERLMDRVRQKSSDLLDSLAKEFGRSRVSDAARSESRDLGLKADVRRKKPVTDRYNARFDEILARFGAIHALTGDPKPEAVLKREALIKDLVTEQMAEEARRIEQLGLEDRFGYTKERGFDPLRIILGHLKNDELYLVHRQAVVEFILSIRSEDSALFDWTLGLLVDNAVFDRTNKKNLTPEELDRKRQGDQSVNLLKGLIGGVRKDARLYEDLLARLRAVEFRGRYGSEKKERIHAFISRLIEKVAQPVQEAREKTAVINAPSQRGQEKVEFSAAEKRVALDVAAQTLRTDKVGLFSDEAWRGFWTSLVPNAYADQVMDLGMETLTRDVLTKAQDAPFKVSVTLTGKPSVNDPVIRLLAETLVGKPGIVVQIVAPELSRSESRLLQQELTKKVMASRKDQRSSAKGVKLFVTSESGAVSEFASGGQVRTLVYDMRSNVQAELESLALRIAKGETLIVSDAVELGQKAYALLAALDKLFDQQQLPQTVQSAAQLLSENLRIAAEAARSILQAA